MKLLLLLSLLILSACQSLEIDTPTPNVEPPETPGKKQFIGDLSAMPAQTLTITSNAGSRPPDLTNPSVGHSGMLGALGDFGLTDRFSVAVQMNSFLFDGSFLFLRAKLQLIGEPFTKRKEGVQMAVWGRSGYGSSSSSGDQNEALGSGGYPWSGVARDRVLGVGASIGYRFNDHFQAYLGAARDWHYVRAKISQDAAKGTAGGTYKTYFDGVMNAAHFGVLYSHNLGRVGLVATYSDSDFEEAEPLDEVYGGLILGFALDKPLGRKSKARKAKEPADEELKEGEECVETDEYECV